MIQVISAYRGRKLVYRSVFSFDAKTDKLVASWKANGCRVTRLKFKSP